MRLHLNRGQVEEKYSPTLKQKKLNVGYLVATLANLIKERLGYEMSLGAAGDLLHRQGLTPQKPMRRAYERDDVIKNGKKRPIP